MPEGGKGKKVVARLASSAWRLASPAVHSTPVVVIHDGDAFLNNEILLIRLDEQPEAARYAESETELRRAISDHCILRSKRVVIRSLLALRVLTTAIAEARSKVMLLERFESATVCYPERFLAFDLQPAIGGVLYLSNDRRRPVLNLPRFVRRCATLWDQCGGSVVRYESRLRRWATAVAEGLLHDYGVIVHANGGVRIVGRSTQRVARARNALLGRLAAVRGSDALLRRCEEDLAAEVFRYSLPAEGRDLGSYLDQIVEDELRELVGRVTAHSCAVSATRLALYASFLLEHGPADKAEQIVDVLAGAADESATKMAEEAIQYFIELHDLSRISTSWVPAHEPADLAG